MKLADWREVMKPENNWLMEANWLGWTARIWSLLLLLFVVARIITPDPYATEPVPTEDWFLLSFWALAIVSLILAWRWPKAGAVMAVTIMAARELAWILLKDGWLINFLLIWLIIVPPAVFYWLSARQAKPGPAG